MSSRIINPATGRWVVRHGKIGRNLIRMSRFTPDFRVPLVRSRKRYSEVTRLWDWWARLPEEDYHRVAEIFFDPQLIDPRFKAGNYPFYVMSYEAVLRKAWKAWKKLEKREKRNKPKK